MFESNGFILQGQFAVVIPRNDYCSSKYGITQHHPQCYSLLRHVLAVPILTMRSIIIWIIRTSQLWLVTRLSFGNTLSVCDSTAVNQTVGCVKLLSRYDKVDNSLLISHSEKKKVCKSDWDKRKASLAALGGTPEIISCALSEVNCQKMWPFSLSGGMRA